MVTTKGFTKYARDLASHYQIHPLQVNGLQDAVMKVEDAFLGVAADNANYLRDNFKQKLKVAVPGKKYRSGK